MIYMIPSQLSSASPTLSCPEAISLCAHKVRSLGIWLKLEMGMELILLLFKVLQE